MSVSCPPPPAMTMLWSVSLVAPVRYESYVAEPGLADAVESPNVRTTYPCASTDSLTVVSELSPVIDRRPAERSNVTAIAGGVAVTTSAATGALLSSIRLSSGSQTCDQRAKYFFRALARRVRTSPQRARSVSEGPFAPATPRKRPKSTACARSLSLLYHACVIWPGPFLIHRELSGCTSLCKSGPPLR